MIAEILCIGTELLLGEITNTNAAYISRKLAGLGIDCYYQTCVGDNAERIKLALEIALQRSDIIILTGGLGPTDDDITIQTLAEFFDESLICDENSLQEMRNFFENLNIIMSDANIKQTLRPKGAIAISNPVGTAPGIFWKISNYKKNMDLPKIIFAFPGVPDELYAMWNTAENYLKQYSQTIQVHKES